MSSHPLAREFDKKLTDLAIKTDNFLEDNFGSLYQIHPRRGKRGTTASGLYDGLFATFFKFSTGYGTKSGRGYIISIEIRTLEKVKIEDKNLIEKEAINFIKTNLNNIFPNRKLDILFEKNVYKLVGDFSLN